MAKTLQFDEKARHSQLIPSNAKYANGVRVAVTGASNGGVFRWKAAEVALSANFSGVALAGLSCPADGMIADLHGTAVYRAHLVGVMTKRAVAAAQ